METLSSLWKSREISTVTSREIPREVREERVTERGSEEWTSTEPENVQTVATEKSSEINKEINTEEMEGRTRELMTTSAFIETVAPCAIENFEEYEILASVTLAQAILESGWGSSSLSQNANALFGIKATSDWTGQVYDTVTKECLDGATLTSVSAMFRAYGSWEESVADHGAFLAQQSRYAGIIGEKDPEVVCQKLLDAGYATAPDYPSKLMTLINQYQLQQYDTIYEEETMSHSSMVCYTKISPNSTYPRRNSISKITIHCMAGNLSVESCGSIFADKTRSASSHYGIGSDGRVALYVEEDHRAWTTGGTKSNCDLTGAENDHMAVTIEVANDGGVPDWHVSDVAFASLLDLVTDIAKRNGIYPVTFTGDSTGTLTAHRWFAAKDCPGDYLMGRFEEIAKIVTARLDGVAYEPAVAVSSVVSSSPVNYTVKVTTDSLNIRTGAGTQYDVVTAITMGGTYTIVEESTGTGATMWGRLKSGIGWISLDFCVKNSV